MNPFLTLATAAGVAADPARGRFSDHMLSELLLLHEDMVGQLCVERLESSSNVAFLTEMIAQHEATAAMLRIHLGNRVSLLP